MRRAGIELAGYLSREVARMSDGDMDGKPMAGPDSQPPCRQVESKSQVQALLRERRSDG